MRPFIVDGLRTLQGKSVVAAIEGSLPENSKKLFRTALAADETKGSPDVKSVDHADVGQFPDIVSSYWKDAFEKRISGNRETREGFRDKLYRVTAVRNIVMHPSSRYDVRVDDARQALSDINWVLDAICPDGVSKRLSGGPWNWAEAMAGLTEELQTYAAPSGQSQEDEGPKYKPWREVITPKWDVLQGVLRAEDFAANLQAVYDGGAEESLYGNPVSFFRNTYITEGISQLLRSTLKRLAGRGDGYAVVQAKTGFGGGKTHSLIALYHLVKSGDIIASGSGDPRDNETRDQIRSIIEEAGISLDQYIQAKVSVLSGDHLSPTSPEITSNGDPLNTLWGVMAYQLGGQAAYELVGGAAREGTAPGGRELLNLFETVGPCVILMDEIVNYARNLSDSRDRRIESLYTFFQNLTGVIARQRNVALVLSLPESEAEVGDERGIAILRRLEAIFGRVQAIW